MMRVGVLEKKNDTLFMPQQTLKERYPMSQYLKSPETNKRLAQFEALGLQPSYETLDGLNANFTDKELSE